LGALGCIPVANIAINLVEQNLNEEGDIKSTDGEKLIEYFSNYLIKNLTWYSEALLNQREKIGVPNI
jgi:hypothetical protein